MFIIYAFILFVISNGIGKILFSKKEEIKVIKSNNVIENRNKE